jgi:1,4-alpha-glucan branching enzyme
VIRLRLRDAHRVEIAGDWNEWTRTPLAQSDADQWELFIALRAGPHRFMVIIDGAPWRIPDGVPSVPDGMGGRVAVLNVF